MTQDISEVKITTMTGCVRISPPLPALIEGMTFKYSRIPILERTFVDPRSDKVVAFSMRGKRPISTDEPLYAIGSDGSMYAHYGLIERVQAFLNRLGVKYTIEHAGPDYIQPTIVPEIAAGLKPQQIECLSAMLPRNYAIAHAATAYGKTIVIAAIIKAFPTAKIMVVTQRKSVCRRLYEGLPKLLNEESLPVGLFNADAKTVQRVTVVSSGCLNHFESADVDVMIFDEVHKAASDSVAKEIVRFDRCRRYGFSGTLGERFDGKNLFIEGLFGPIAYEIMDSEAEEQGMICPIHLYALSVPEGPDVQINSSDHIMESRGITYNDARNKLIKDVASRVPADQQMLIFVRTKEHLEVLKLNYLQDMGFEFFHSGISPKEKRRIQAGFESGEILRVLSTNSMAEGVDPKNLYVLIDANWVTSETEVIQRGGRNRRFGEGGKDAKPYGVVVTFRDEWDPRFARKAAARLKQYTDRGYQLFDFSSPEDIVFVGDADEVAY